MKILKSLAIFVFDIIDKFIHQERILRSLKKNIHEIKIFIDVGSHKGTYTDLILKNFGVREAFLFEPQKNIYKFIKKKYKLKKKIKVFNNAVSNKNRTVKIFINKHDLTSSLTKLNKKNLYLNFKAKLFGGNIGEMIEKSYDIKSVKLTDLIKKKKLKNVDLLKIDTEGHEREVLEGLGKKISIIKIILIEIHNDNIYLKYSSSKIHNYLLKNKFALQKRIKFPFTTWEDRIYIKKLDR
tara:strand:+ start:2739 stop:3455 length:717 start_codon:yes stop_codon:yes gene_type:complete